MLSNYVQVNSAHVPILHTRKANPEAGQSAFFNTLPTLLRHKDDVIISQRLGRLLNRFFGTCRQDHASGIGADVTAATRAHLQSVVWALKPIGR